MTKRRKKVSSSSLKTNKSQAIRDYKKAHPKDKPVTIASELGKVGIEVSAQFVSTVLSNSKKHKKTRKPGRPKGSVSSGKSSAKSSRAGKLSDNNVLSDDNVSFESLLMAKQIVTEMGGISQAKAALRALEQLMI